MYFQVKLSFYTAAFVCFHCLSKKSSGFILKQICKLYKPLKCPLNIFLHLPFIALIVYGLSLFDTKINMSEMQFLNYIFKNVHYKINTNSKKSNIDGNINDKIQHGALKIHLYLPTILVFCRIPQK